MTPLVKLRLGNLFDGPSDLIVLPCSTGGTITDFVAQALRKHKIPLPRDSYSLGEVDIQPFEGGENIAQYVAYAASVLYYPVTSTSEVIRLIGSQLGSATQKYPSIRSVSAPLLGAGAGGLRSEQVIKSLEDGFKFSAHKDAVLTISILNAIDFRRLSGQGVIVKDPLRQNHHPEETLRVFISYTGANPDTKNWVVLLATYLRENGIESRLDQWHLRKGMDLPQWMTNELTMADRVIVVSDEYYAAKADGRLGGVGWETMIIQGDMQRLSPESNKYLIIVKAQDLDSGLPKYLKTKYCDHWPFGASEETHQQELLKELYNIDLAPLIGEPPAWL